jgi:MoaA/NifB/PqqE/SkfB family radical SAM enzyme
MSQKEGKHLSLDDYREIIRQAKDLDVLSWNITGGEPLLVPWLNDLITLLEPDTHYISIQTNCMLLTRERALQLKQLGVNCITTSLDSIEPEEHNAFRGNPSSYQKVFEGIKNAKSAGMQVLVAGTITHQNLRSDKLKKLITSVNKLGVIFLYNLAVPCGNWDGNFKILLRDDDRNYLLKLMEKYPMTSTDHEAGRNAIGCPAGKEKLYITAYGDVIPCPFIHISFGNVKNTPLYEIVKKMQKIPYFSQYPKICTAAEDTEFIENILNKIDTKNKTLPIPAEMIFKEYLDS